ncbi:helix-turn-helix transcriptional regulator [Xanthobacter autotrophicus]|uniref:helix-turn-helix transcriptional regulator n=1 Tax=Xanthobacter autotrophicus TaxID=280 RepID=UPI003726CBCB
MGNENVPAAANDDSELPAFFRRRLLTPPHASAYLSHHLGCNVAVATLAKWRCLTSFGPPFHKVMRKVVYARDDLDAWIAARLGKAQRSTSETGDAA